MPRVGPVRGTLAVLRGGIVVLWLVLAILIYLPLKWIEPLTGGWRPRYGVMRLWARGSLWLMGLRRELHGAEPARGAALVANHSSWLDIMAFCSIGRVAFVAKSEVATWPVIGWCARMMDAMFVERRSSAAGRQKAEMAERLARGQQLLFFPEGTSTDGLRVLPFKSALFAVFGEMGPDALIQPVAARYVPAPGLPDAFYGWWGDMSLGGHLWAMLAHSVGGTVHLAFDTPVRASDFPDRKALAAHCGASVQRMWAAHAIPQEISSGN